MKALPFFCLLTLIAGTATAKDKKYDDLLLEDGTTLKEVTVLKVEPDGLRLAHKNGVSKVKYEDLPEMVRKEYSFDQEKATAFRIAQDTAREARNAAEQKERVEEVLQQRHEEQDSDLQRTREAFFRMVESDEYSFPQLDKSLLDGINVFKEAGRKDLAAILEEDRKLLRERELVRPGEKYRKERDLLLDRIRALEAQLAANPPAGVQPVRDTTYVPFYVDRPVIVPVPSGGGNDPDCPPGKPTTPPTRPGPRPGYGNGTGNGNGPGITPIPPVTRPSTPVPSRPTTPPVSRPSVPSAPSPPAISSPSPARPTFTPAVPQPVSPQPAFSPSLPSGNGGRQSGEHNGRK